MKYFEIEGIEVGVEYKPRNKNSYISIDSKGAVRLKTPMKLAFRIKALLHNRLDWIKAKQLEIASKVSLQAVLGETLILDGECIALSQCTQLAQMCERLQVKNESSLERCYNRFYLQRSREELPLHAKELSQQIGLFPKELRFRKMKRQWGNCNTDGVITLSTALMKLTKIQRSYIIAHELCHLKHMNHSRHFYALLYDFFPHAQAIEKELKEMRY